MIKTLLKHKLAELAIEQIFNNIQSNFSTCDDHHMFKVDDKYHSIECTFIKTDGSIHECLYNTCRVVYAYPHCIRITFDTKWVRDNDTGIYSTEEFGGFTILSTENITNFHL